MAGQLGRPPRPMSAVAARCPHTFPAVVEVLPADERGRPFPTLYYLTCPTAVAAIGALESAGGVERFQRAVDADDGLRAALAEAARETRARREELARPLGRETAETETAAAEAAAPGAGSESSAPGLVAGESSAPGLVAGESSRAGWTVGESLPAGLAASLATGVGGVADPSRLKCLHAHAAHALARPAYRVGTEIIAAAGGLWCDDRRCAAYAGDEQ